MLKFKTILFIVFGISMLGGFIIILNVANAQFYVPPVEGVCVEAPGYPCNTPSSNQTPTRQPTKKPTKAPVKKPTVDKDARIHVDIKWKIATNTAVLKAATKDCNDYQFCLTAQKFLADAINCPAIIQRCQPSKPTWDLNTFDCDKRSQYKPAGVVSDQVVMTYTCAGMAGVATTIPEMKDPLCKVAALAAADGYTLAVVDSYRPFKEQVDGWCIIDGNLEPNKRVKKRAVPGTSSHGKGRAVDVKLLSKSGKDLYANKYSEQRKIPIRFVRRLAKYFYEADPNFVRYQREIWHFEYGTAGQGNVGKFMGWPNLK